MSEALASSSAHPLSESRTGPSILLFGEVLMDCFPDREVEGGAPLNVACQLRLLGRGVDVMPLRADEFGEDAAGRR